MTHKRLSKKKQARRDYLPPALAAIRDTAMNTDVPLNPEVLNADLFGEAIAEIKKLKEIREGATHWAGNAVHFQQQAGELQERLAGSQRLVESQRDVIRKLRSEEWQSRLLLSELVSTEVCQLDHCGYCQSHGWMRTEPTCPHGRAEALLRKGHRHPA